MIEILVHTTARLYTLEQQRLLTNADPGLAQFTSCGNCDPEMPSEQ